MRTQMIKALVILFVITFMSVPLMAEGTAACTEKMWLPEGSSAMANPNGTITVNAPSNFAYVGRDNFGEVALAVAATNCSCTCTKNAGSCNPSVLNGNCSCTAMDGCTACSLSTSAAAEPAKTTHRDDPPAASDIVASERRAASCTT